MYILQFLNASTHAVIREERLADIAHIARIIKAAEEQNETNEPLYIVDQSLRPIEATFVSKSVIHLGTESVYKLFFKINTGKTPL
ncbi:hypothetical protein [Bacillus marasmi]|uniref:hypothetical protein n=1 Tax=Bacillus marasmi TaxID=1926279 RepID=UPI0011CA6C29|nr:hypothetical protein [Bacillus marasmi]